jgi:hypothetical protein
VKAEGWSYKYIGTVLDLERAIKEWQFMTYRKIAYSKKVTVDTIEPSEYDYHMVYVPMMKDGASAHARIEMKELTGNTTSYHSKNEFEVLSPSHDEYEVDESVWSENIHINERLELKEERGNRGKWDVCILNPKLTIK